MIGSHDKFEFILRPISFKDNVEVLIQEESSSASARSAWSARLEGFITRRSSTVLFFNVALQYETFEDAQ